MNDALKKPEKYRKRYMRSHKIMTMILDNEKDADILAWLDDKPNKSEAVRELIRKEVNNE